MILYAVGGELTAGAYLANRFKVASDDINYVLLGSVPHPANLKMSWSNVASKMCSMALINRSSPWDTVDVAIASYNNALDFVTINRHDGYFVVFELYPDSVAIDHLRQVCSSLKLISIPHLVITAETDHTDLPTMSIGDVMNLNNMINTHYQIGMMVSYEINTILKERE